MSILYKTLRLTLITCGLVFSASFVYAQAKNAIGVGLALNSTREGAGFGGILQGEVKINRFISITPALGAETPYVVYASFGGRYYFSPDIYGSLGALGHIGNLDGDSDGYGGTAGIGFILLSTTRDVIDLGFHCDYITLKDNGTPLVGLRLTYNFSFNKLNQ
ncbi:MAG: hypothetical protein JWR38_144 [Mucilaginibacter sp.]|nr:hypothetical protein [Mucilaginibacter sp.]